MISAAVLKTNQKSLANSEVLWPASGPVRIMKTSSTIRAGYKADVAPPVGQGQERQVEQQRGGCHPVDVPAGEGILPPMLVDVAPVAIVK